MSRVIVTMTTEALQKLVNEAPQAPWCFGARGELLQAKTRERVCRDWPDFVALTPGERLALQAPQLALEVLRLRKQLKEFDPSSLADTKTGRRTPVFTLDSDGLTVDMEEE